MINTVAAMRHHLARVEHRTNAQHATA